MAVIITGHGRSCTKWLAVLLKAPHEPLSDYDVPRYAKAYNNQQYASSYISGRIPKMHWPIEVNSYLRYCIPQLRTYGYSTTAIIRNGHDVVRSMLWRRTRSPIDAPSTSRVAELSWYWAETYRILTDHGVPIFKCERLTGRDGTLHDQISEYQSLCACAGIKPDLERWLDYRHQRINTSPGAIKDIVFHDRELAEFDRYAGDIQGKFYVQS